MKITATMYFENGIQGIDSLLEDPVYAQMDITTKQVPSVEISNSIWGSRVYVTRNDLSEDERLVEIENKELNQQGIRVFEDARMYGNRVDITSQFQSTPIQSETAKINALMGQRSQGPYNSPSTNYGARH